MGTLNQRYYTPFLSLFLSTLFLLWLLISCTSSPDSLLLGRWKQKGRNVVLEFQELEIIETNTLADLEDISGAVSIICDHITIDGYYKWEDNSNISIYPNMLHDECFEVNPADNKDIIVFKYHVDQLTETKLILSSLYSPNTVTEYNRVE